MRFRGDRMRIVQLQQRSVTYDAANQQIDNFPPDGGTIIRDYVQKVEMQGKETDRDGALIATQDIRFKMRYRAINKRDWRIVEGSSVYDIENIQVIGRNEGMWLMCKLRDNGVSKDILELSDSSLMQLDLGYLEVYNG